MQPLKKELKVRVKGAKRIAVLGIGSPLRGDDVLGLLIIEELKKALIKVKKTLPLKLFSCGSIPENYTGEIKKFKPSHFLIVDAVDTGKKAGKISIIDAKKRSADVSFSTHRLPIKMLIDYLSHYLDCQIISIGIQPKSIEFGIPLSKEVEKNIKKVSFLIKEVLTQNRND